MLFALTRNQAFADHDGRAGDLIEVADPEAAGWAELIAARILVAARSEGGRVDASAPAPEPEVVSEGVSEVKAVRRRSARRADNDDTDGTDGTPDGRQ